MKETFEDKYQLKPIFCTILKKNRKKKNYSQAYVAGKLNIDRTTVGRYENGKREIPAYVLPYFNALYDIDMEQYDKGIQQHLLELGVDTKTMSQTDTIRLNKHLANKLMLHEKSEQPIAKETAANDLKTLFAVNNVLNELNDSDLSEEQKESLSSVIADAVYTKESTMFKNIGYVIFSDLTSGYIDTLNNDKEEYLLNLEKRISSYVSHMLDHK